MKLHRNLALAVVETIKSVFEANAVAGRTLEALFALHPKWGKRDRAFIAEAVYEIVRWRRLFAHSAQSEGEWALLVAYLLRQQVELPEWEEFAAFDAPTISARRQSSELPRAIRESVPDWLDAYGQTELGVRWEAELSALNQSAPVVLRANTLKISRDELQSRLSAEGIATEPINGLHNALQLLERRSISRHELYKSGFFEFQDAASQIVAPFVQVEPGMMVLDACAGAGGKTLHLASLMRNRGQITAFDVEEAKLTELRRRASRNGVSNVTTKVPRPHDLQHLQGKFDSILIDAPCSGSGTLRRQPDLKWRLSPESLTEVEAKQRVILKRYSPLLKEGGQMVYATCSIFPAENERQVEWFLGQDLGFEVDEQQTISPAEMGFDGFFMARLSKR